MSVKPIYLGGGEKKFRPDEVNIDYSIDGVMKRLEFDNASIKKGGKFK